MSQTLLSTSNTLTLDEFIARLSCHQLVDGIVLIGSTGRGDLTPTSDYDLLLVLSQMPAPFTVALTWIDHRLTDIIFATRQQIEEILALDTPANGEEWPGRFIQWLQTGRIAFDRTGRLAQAQTKVQSDNSLLPLDNYDVYMAWFGLNYNLNQTRRLMAAEDPVYWIAADIRLAHYGTSDLLWRYFRIRKLRWQGEKSAVRYLSSHDPNYLTLLQQFLAAGERRAKFSLYEQLVALAAAPGGGLWLPGATAIEFKPEGFGPTTAAEALGFWEGLLTG
jgi:predicted nucleotidyltransferase